MRATRLGTLPPLMCLCALVACGGGGSAFVFVEDPEVSGLLGIEEVWAASDSDVWAVGLGGVLRYDGVRWTKQQLPVTKSFTAVWGAAPDQVWVVGDDVALHWNGSAWSSETFEGGIIDLSDVHGSSASDVWTVGGFGFGFHWDGQQWTSHQIKNTQAEAVWVVSPQNAWTASSSGFSRWDGSAWSEVDTGHQGAEGLWGSGENDIWAVGGSDGPAHWDGSAWTASGADDFEVSAVWGRAAGDIWAVGLFGTIAHWDGSAWSRVAGGDEFFIFLSGIHALPSGAVWIAGSYQGPEGIKGVVLHRAP